MGLITLFYLQVLFALVLLVPDFCYINSFHVFLVGHTICLIMTWLTNAAFHSADTLKYC